ncbi:zinc finger, CCHC-type containing protein [Tanacetum coccineum]
MQLTLDAYLVPYLFNLMTTQSETRRYSGVSSRNKKLTGPNFIDWYRQLLPPEALAAHAAWVKGQKEVVVLMLLTMDLDIQRNLAHLGAYDMLQELKAMFSKQAEQELLQTVREFHTCKQEEGQSVSSHVLKMKGYIDNLERLSQPVGQNLAVSLILVSLNKDFANFVKNFNMHGMGKTVNELHAMLKLHEETLPKKDANPALHAIRAGRVQKNQKNKPHKAAKRGHGKGTVPLYLAELMKKEKPIQEARLQGSTGKVREADTRGFVLLVGDGQSCSVEAIGTYHLELPSGLVIVLNNCHYAPSITRGVISVSRLFDDGFINRFDDNNVISVSKNNLTLLSCGIRLGHISMNALKSSKNDGLLNSIDIESLERCVSCLSGKMARKPYSHQVERAKDLLGLIHTDVCGPFRIVSRQGASYFVTFTDDFSRYGYVYLLKHKHEVFETFKSFWDYALETAARILNMVPTKKVDKTP